MGTQHIICTGLLRTAIVVAGVLVSTLVVVSAARAESLTRYEPGSLIQAEWALEEGQPERALSLLHRQRAILRDSKFRTQRDALACQAYIQLCCREMMNGTANFGDIAMLKVQCSQTLEFCAREAMQILGGIGYMRGNRVERIYREVRVNAIGGGSEEIMRDLASRQYQL